MQNVEVVLLFIGNVLLYASFPFLFASQKSPRREVSFYIYISVMLVLGGFFGSVYSIPLSESVAISGGNILYGALMMSIVLLLIVQGNLDAIHNIFRLVLTVSIFNILLVSFLSFVLGQGLLTNPYGVSAGIFNSSIWVQLLGAMLILIELGLILLVFEKAKQHIGNLTLLSILYVGFYIMILCLDGLLFTILFSELSPEIGHIVLGGIEGKFITAAAYSIPMFIFLYVFRDKLASFASHPLPLSRLMLMSTDRLVEEVERTRTYLEMNRHELGDAIERLSIATRSANIGIWEWDEARQVLDWDAKMREMYRIDPVDKEVYPATWFNLIHPDDAEMGRNLLDSGTQVDELVAAKLRVLFDDGDIRHMQIHAHKQVNERGHWLKTVGVSWDITEQVNLQLENAELQAQQHQSQKMESIGMLAGGIAHDFNNLLVPIIGYADLTLMKLDASSPVFEDVHQIRASAEKAAGITKQILAFSRQQILEVAEVNLNELVVDFSEILRQLIGKHIELVTQLDPDLHLVSGDKSQLEQVILNLVINARDAMPSGGRITIATTNANIDVTHAESHPDAFVGTAVMLSVTDTGTGIDRSLQNRIFEPFFSTKSEDFGSGLGLATVYGVVKQHQGNISVYSEPGQGAKFRVYLPGFDAPSSSIRSESIEPNSLYGTETILVVENEDAVRHLVADTLRAHGYVIIETSDVEHCEQLIRSSDSEVVMLLTDVLMPGLNGDKLYEKLLSIFPDLKVLYMSGFTDEAVLDDDNSIDHTHYLQKPFGIRKLLVKVRGVIDKDGASDEVDDR